MNKLNVHRLMEVLSDILSEQHGAKITITLRPKTEDELALEKAQKAKTA